MLMAPPILKLQTAIVRMPYWPTLTSLLSSFLLRKGLSLLKLQSHSYVGPLLPRSSLRPKVRIGCVFTQEELFLLGHADTADCPFCAEGDTYRTTLLIAFLFLFPSLLSSFSPLLWSSLTCPSSLSYDGRLMPLLGEARSLAVFLPILF